MIPDITLTSHEMAFLELCGKWRLQNAHKRTTATRG
jgi:hypothetical protein